MKGTFCGGRWGALALPALLLTLAVPATALADLGVNAASAPAPAPALVAPAVPAVAATAPAVPATPALPSAPASMTLTTNQRSNCKNTSGYALQDLNPYQANDTEKTYQNVFPVGPFGIQINTIHDENNELISKGPDPNQIVHLTTNTMVTVDQTAMPPVTIVTSMSRPGLK